MKKRTRDSGMLSLEACIVVPAFIILMLMVNGIFIMLMGQHSMNHALIQSAKSLAFDPYASQRIAADKGNELGEALNSLVGSIASDGHTSSKAWYEAKDGSMETAIKERFVAHLRNNESDARELLDAIGVVGGVDGLDFSESKVADGVLTLKLKYTQEFVLNAAGLASFDREISISVKLFEYKPLS